MRGGNSFELIKGYLRSIRSRNNRINVWMLHNQNVGYIAVPKAASSSIRNALRGYAAETCLRDLSLSHTEIKAAVDGKIHYSTTVKKLMANEQRPFLFSFVRHPITRLYSCYRDKVMNSPSRRERCSLSAYGIRFGMTFNEFVEHLAEVPDDQSDQHFRSQHKMITYRGNLVVDFLGKFEHVERDWAWMESKYGIRLPSRPLRVSGPPTANHELPLSYAVANKAVERYQEDIELFGYQKQTESILGSLKLGVCRAAPTDF